MSKKLISVILILMMATFLFACGNGTQTPQAPEMPDQEQNGEVEEQAQPAPFAGNITLATTTSTEDSGLLGFLLPEFTFETGWEVMVISVGTGMALQIGRDGEADVLLVHARALEDQFVADGYAERRYDIMYNDFIIVGPADGPIAHNDNVNETFMTILNDNIPFVSRGDNSGTHVRELDIWSALDATPQDNDSYIEVGQGMGATLGMAIEMNAFTLSDRATWLNFPNHSEHVIVCEGDPKLLNPYGIMVVSSTLEPDGARVFVDWMIGARGQYLIGQFGVDEFGAPVFFPEAQ